MTDDENPFETTEEPIVRPKRGRPSKSGAATETVITRRILTENENTKPSGIMTFGSLFEPGDDDTNDETVVRVIVERISPDEGLVGYIEDMEATEAYLKEQWGGSTYRLKGLNAKNKPIRLRTIKIAGDPIFLSEAAEMKYRRAHGLPPRMQAPTTTGFSPQEFMAMIDAKEEKKKQEDEIKRKEEKEALEERRRYEREAEENRRRDERNFQLEKDRTQREWEAIRKREEGEREDRRRRESEEAMQRQQQFMQQMLLMTQQQAQNTISFVKETVGSSKSNVDPTDSFMKAVQLILTLKESFAGDNGGGKEEDLITTVIKNLPAMLNSAGNAVGRAVQELKGNPSRPQLPAAGALTLPPGQLSQKMSQLMMKIQESGGNPEEVLTLVADKLLQSADGIQPQNTAPMPSPPVMDVGPNDFNKQTTAPIMQSSNVSPITMHTGENNLSGITKQIFRMPMKKPNAHP